MAAAANVQVRRGRGGFGLTGRGARDVSATMPTFAVLTFPNIDPVIFSLGPFAVRWYGVAYIAGFVFAAWYMKRLVTNAALWDGAKPTATARQIDDFFIWTVLAVVLGGRLGYVLFYNPAFYFSHPLDILRMWDGGMSFHGGFLGVVVAAYAYGRKIGAGLDRMLDLAPPRCR
jgi:phosphatidylglycerol:prolipoprotein diacylglycerol transferase